VSYELTFLVISRLTFDTLSYRACESNCNASSLCVTKEIIPKFEENCITDYKFSLRFMIDVKSP
jgi:hypothetical protein